MEGLKVPYLAHQTCQYFYEKYKNCEGAPNIMLFYWCYGKDLNDYYHLTGDNQYDNKIGIFFIDWSNFGKEFKADENKGPFRYFSDVVDNNAYREIRKGNPHYKNYHSIYDDE